MKLGVISDTHGDAAAAQRALKILDSLNVSLIIHCGDIGPEVVAALQGRRVHFVRGNMDAANEMDDRFVDPAHTFHLDFGSLELEGRRVAFLHGHDIKLLHHTIHSGDWDLVCHGHTHAFGSSREGETLVLNPGALSRTRSPSLAIVELPTMEVLQIPT
jgi:uncharacterized protein